MFPRTNSGDRVIRDHGSLDGYDEEPHFIILAERPNLIVERKPTAAETLQEITSPSHIPQWNDDEFQFASWVNNVLDVEVQCGIESRPEVDGVALSDEQIDEIVARARAEQQALSKGTLIHALRTGQSLSDPQRMLIADCLEDQEPKPKRMRGRPKGSGRRSDVHDAGRDVDRYKEILRRYFPKQKGIPARALELAADFWRFDPTTVENFRKSPRRMCLPVHK